jgi:HD-GYP domain-containing protein (c-di-GMP phosphodiesterase class II)
MNSYVKSIVLMLVTQACCVTMGLHMHDTYLRASIAQGEIDVSDNQAEAVQALNNVQPMYRLLTVGWILTMQIFVAFLTLSRIYTEMTAETDSLRVTALTRERQVRKTRDALIFGLAALAESRDPETGRHLERISLYSSRLASELYRRGTYSDVITREFLRTIGSSSTLHDIGKVSVRDDVLRKPGPLTAEERRHIQTHTTVGGECIRSVEAQTGDSQFLKMAREIALCHHERWDGTGYPRRLAGRNIPLAARIVSIADVYDALSMRRTYKPALPHQLCVDMIAAGAGTQFDPVLVAAFLEIEAEFAEIARRNLPADQTSDDGHVLPDFLSCDESGEIAPSLEDDPGDEVIPLSLLLSSLQAAQRQPAIPVAVAGEQQEVTAAALPGSPSA